MLNRFAVIAAVAFLSAIGPSPVYAQTGPTFGKPDFSADLIVGGVDRSNAAVAFIAVHVRLGPHWHTYWRSAGDAGAPPEFDWSNSQNLIAADVEWPAPHRLTEGGIDVFGYTDEVVFPVRLRLRDPQVPTHISLKLTLFVCGAICTGNDLHFEAAIAPQTRSASALALIETWRSKVPRQQAAGLSIASAKLLVMPTPSIRLTVATTSPLQEPDIFIDGDGDIVGGRAQVVAHDRNATTFLVPLSGPDATRPSKPLVITLVDGDRAIEATLQPAPGASHAVDRSITADDERDGQIPDATWTMLAIALLGGFVLNFMPCVFPVLALKIFSLAGQISRDHRVIRKRFVASAAGVIASFLLLAITLSALKAFGAQVGWGIQFQQPLFLVGMIVVLVALASNLFGLYDILLPAGLNAVIARQAGDESPAAHFVNGLAMTLLATPCSAPFVGTAVAFALSQGPWQIMEIFAALGTGMASPYLLLGAVPQVAHVFPRPGRWMLALRRVAGMAMVGTAIWLLTILAQITHLQIALTVGVSLGLVVSVLALRRRGAVPALAATFMTGLAAIALVLPNVPLPRIEDASSTVPWQPFVPQDIGGMVQEGRTVLVNIGAAWCVTCKVNDAIIAGNDSIRSHLVSDVVPMRADWTRRDDAIGAYLQSFHRYGLPFDAVFGPGAPSGIVLPELLTPTDVLAAIDQASATPSTSH